MAKSSDYVVRFTGQDNLSKTTKQIKDELNSVGTAATSAADKIDQKFNKIINSSAPLKRQLKDLQAIMAEMNMKGLSNTDQFTVIAQKAGEIKNAINDAAAATSKFANDTMGLQASIQAFQGIAAAGGVATGIMAMFGSENENVTNAIRKTQGALAIMNGIQQIANVLNKDSILMHKLKQIQMNVNTAATEKNTVAQKINNATETTANITKKSNTIATVANTASTNVNTAATGANTLATKAWNTAKAIGKALLGDFTGLLLVGGAALVTYAAATGNASKEQEEMTEDLNEAAEAQKRYQNTMSDTYSSLMTKYSQLKAEWNSLKTVHEKNKWITDNKNRLNELEVSVNNVADAEKVFNGNTQAVVDGFIRRAKAAARLAELTELYKKQMELLDKRSTISAQIASDAARSGRTARTGDEIKDPTYRNKRYGSVDSSGKWVFHDQGAKLYSGTDTSNNTDIKSIDNQLDVITSQVSKIVSGIEKDVKSTSSVSTSRTTHSIPTHTTTTTKNDKSETPKPVAGSLDDLEEQFNKAKKRLTSGLFDPEETTESLQKLLKDLEEKIKAKKIELGIELSDEAKKELEKAQQKIKTEAEINVEIEDIISEIEKNKNKQKSSFEQATEQYQEKPNKQEALSLRLDELQDLMDKNDEWIKDLEEQKKKLEEIGDTGTDAYKKIEEQLDSLNQEQLKLGEEAASAAKKQDKFRKTEKTLNDIADAASNTATIFGNLGQVTEDDTLQAAGIIAEAVANIIAGYAAASEEAGGTLGPWGWAAFSLAGLAQVTSVISQIHSLSGYAEGGIVTGGSTTGDNILARLNAGEMVINARQQANLFKAIDSGDFGNNNSNNSFYVDWRIKGCDLYATMKNYSKTVAKTGKNTGIR